MGNPIRVLVVDDSALVRQILTQGLDADPEIEVVASAPDPSMARDRIVELRPDVLTLDVEMPRMDGVEFLRRLMPQHPLPVVMVSSLTQRGKQITLDALAAGAVDIVAKPTADVGRSLPKMMGELREKVQIAARADVSQWRGAVAAPPPPRPKTAALAESTDKVIAIGASTGGTEALRQVIGAFPPDMPGTVVVQHMPAGFTNAFAARLDEEAAVQVKEAESGDRIMTGRVLIAPGDFHMQVARRGGIYEVVCRSGDKVCGHRPSVEVLFDSVAQQVGANAVGAILTGMGHDGALSLRHMRDAGARTVGQDEATSVVYGMPKAAWDEGGVEVVKPIGEITHTLLGLLR